MCYGATCPTCSKQSWRGCGRHVPQALAGVPKDQWCTCEARFKVDGVSYPAAAPLSIPGLSWVSSLWGGGGGGGGNNKKTGGGRDDL